MAKKLSQEEQQRTKADFDAPKKRGGHGRPPSPRPRTATLTFRLTEAEKEKLEEAARMTGETKTGVIVEGIDLVYSKAIAAEKKRQQDEQKTITVHTKIQDVPVEKRTVKVYVEEVEGGERE